MARYRMVPAFVLFLTAPLFAATRYVEAVGSDTGDCLSAPCRTIGHAIARADAGDVIQVAAGRFGSGLWIDKAVTVRGAQAGVDARGRTGAESILSGPVWIRTDGVVLDGFTIDGEDDTVALILDRAAGFHLLNDVIRGGGIQVEVFPAEGVTVSEIRQCDFIGIRDYRDELGESHKTYGLLVGSGIFDSPEKVRTSLVVDSNRFANHSASMLFAGGVTAGAQGIVISGNQFALVLSGHAVDLQRVDGVEVAGNAITGSGDAAVRISNSRNVTVTANTIRNNTYAGVETREGGEGIRIERNTLLENMRALALGTPADVHFNRFAGNAVDIDALGGGEIASENNWFGCNAGPAGCGVLRTSSGTSIDASPWLVMTLTASPNRIALGRSTIVYADLNHNSDGAFVPGFPDGMAIDFEATGGTVDPVRSLTSQGIATTVFKPAGPGMGLVTARLDDMESQAHIVTAPVRRRATGH